MKSLLLVLPLLFLPLILSSADSLVLADRGELLYEENFEQLTKRLQVGKGDWQIVDGTSIKGMELKGDKHTAFRKMFLDHQDVIYQFDFKFEGKAYPKFLINYELVHLANCIIKPDGFSISKLNEAGKRKQMDALAVANGGPIEKGDWQKSNVVLDSAEMAFEPGQWYTITIELVGDELAARIGDVVIRGQHSGLKEKKTNFGIQAAGLGEWVHFDNLKIWKAVSKS
tara:strand:- start:2723 stop:3403 length:681 start_codon:yes stop_codon:yes gene_type:complete